MKNKLKLNTVLLISLIVLVVIGLVYIFLNDSKKNNTSQIIPIQTTKVNTNVPNTSINKVSTITTNPNDPNVSIYTSYNLGVQFKYLNNGVGSLQSKPIEAGNTISLDNNNYVKVFQKSPTESVEQAIKNFFPEEFTYGPNCSVVAHGLNKYIIWDNRIPVSYYRQTSLDGSPYQNLDSICRSNMNSDFIIDSNFPNVIYYIEFSHQAADYFADKSGNQWFGTVHLIAK